MSRSLLVHCDVDGRSFRDTGKSLKRPKLCHKQVATELATQLATELATELATRVVYINARYVHANIKL